MANPRRIQTESGDVRTPAHRHQQRVRLERAPVGTLDDRSLPRSAHAPHLGRDAHLDPFRGEPGQQGVGDLRVLVGQRAGQALDHRHATAQARERLAQLQADGAGAEHDEPARERAQREHIEVRKKAGLAQSLDGRHERTRARGEDEAPRANPSITDAHLAGRQELGGLTQQHLATVVAEALRVVVVLDLLDHGAHMRADPRHVHLRRDRGQAEVGGAAHERCDLGGANQRLAGHAAVVQAVAPEALRALDQRHRETELRGDARDHQPARPAADDDEIARAHRPSASARGANRITRRYTV
ncbi:hypothetical protein BMS3Bbin12_01022 [bacterium BMS3Bbin12]|nr:hypothetical protein BMS3Bbin12_01022 [bacterium BMS3Bbin12]GBE50151.1 hypothetical protein BMS3Bbin13_01080 [bacterium BMS3Bbin13]